MLRTFLYAKIHRATVTDASVDYEGSLSVSTDLMEAAGMRPGERILVGVINTGARFETYLIPAPAGAGAIVLNGATAHLGKKGDQVTIMAFAQLAPEQVHGHRAKSVLLGPNNRIVKVSEIPA
ncbi:MAG: aspartate 1-decarboxylase [Verrucomicrobia bacterium]|nr:aspartate 1-decarboxylase [Verrucomicrobiota bacterium]